MSAETSVTIYDTKSRPVLTYHNNYLGGYTQVTTKYNFTGQELYVQTKHKRLAANDAVTATEEFDYTSQGRLATHNESINALPGEMIAHNEYDLLGNLITKQVGGPANGAFTGFQKVDYKYNIRGWLTNINNINDLSDVGAMGDLFAFKINYNDVEGEPEVSKLYNGNISETYWRTASDNTKRKYSYDYDELNRLRNATYQQPDSNGTIIGNYDESASYDKNGNIQSMNRTGNGDAQGFSLPLDQLEYFYDPASPNQLKKVTDATNEPLGFKDDSDGTNDTADDYSYDANGNMLTDQNKGITGITYNHLNLPIGIMFGAQGNIHYIYDALGQKVRKIVESNGTMTDTDYFDGFQYKNQVLQFFPTDERYVNFTQNAGTPERGYYNYVYNYLDHLGNIRLSYGLDPHDQTIKIMEENHYYPFGLKHTNYNSSRKQFKKEETTLEIKPVPVSGRLEYKYKYNGKEWQDELGLNSYDYGARNYEPALGRWMNIDPLAETSRRFSPYVYALNNPMFFIDPDGMETSPPDLVVSGGDTAKAAFKNEVNIGTGGSYNLNVAADGQASLQSTGIQGPMTEQQTAFYNTFDKAISDSNTTSVDIVSNDPDVSIGQFDSGKIDIADAKKLGSSDLTTPQFVSAQGAIGHEVEEQHDKVSAGAGLPNVTRSHTVSGGGLSAENAINGSIRREQDQFRVAKNGQDIPGMSSLRSNTTIGNVTKTVDIIIFNGNVKKVNQN